MAKVQNEELDERLYNAFWSKLQQAKFDIVYFSEHFNRCTVITRAIKYTIVGATTLATGAWMAWGHNQVVGAVCGVAILMLQVLTAISEKFPYEARKLELREMLAELDTLYLEMEDEWRSIYSLKISNSKIQEAIHQYDQKQATIKRHYFKDDALPENERIRIKADEKTEEYFENFL